MALPTLTPEQRAANLAKAAEARKARSELLAAIKAGEQSLAEVLGRAKEDKTVGKTKVSSLVKALPGIGAVKAKQILESAGVDETRRAGGLGEKQREAIIKATS